MTTQTILEDWRSDGPGPGMHLAMTAVSLAVIVTFVLWHAWPSSGPRTEPVAGEPAVGSTAEEAISRGGLAELYGEREAAARTTTEWLYIVESEAHAKSLTTPREFLTDADVHVGGPTATSVVWFDSVESEVRFWQLQDDAAREFLGLPPLTVVDLRGSGQVAVPNAGAGSADSCGFAGHKADC